MIYTLSMKTKALMSYAVQILRAGREKVNGEGILLAQDLRL